MKPTEPQIFEWCPSCEADTPCDQFARCLKCGALTPPVDGDLVSKCCEAHLKKPDDLGRVECVLCGDNDCSTLEMGA